MTLTIRKKLLASFIMVILLTIGVGGFALYQMGSMNNNTIEIGTNWLPSTEAAGAVGQAFVRLRVSDWRYFSAKDDQTRSAALETFNKNKAAFDQGLKNFEANIVFPDERKAFTDARDGANQYLEQHDRLVRLLREGKQQEAATLMMEESLPIYQKTDQATDDMSAAEVLHGGEAVKAAASSYSSARLWMAISLLLIAGMAMAIALWISAYIVRSIAQTGARVEQLRSLCITNMGKGMDAMAVGDLKFEVVTGTPKFDIKTKDEIGALQESINGIIDQTTSTVAAFRTARTNVLALTDQTKALSDAARNGNIDARADETKFQGAYSELLHGVNELLDGVGSRVKRVADRLTQLGGLCVANLGKGTVAMTAGDLNYEIVTGTPKFDVDSKDPIGQSEAGVNIIIDQITAAVESFRKGRGAVLLLIDETKRLNDAARNGDIDARAEVSRYPGAFGELLLGVNELLGVVTTRVKRVADRVEQLGSLCIANLRKGTEAMAEGDLTYEIVTGTPKFEVDSKDPIGKLEVGVNVIIDQITVTVESFRKGRGSLDESLGGVLMSAEQVTSAANEISSSSQSLAQGTSEQASSLEEVTSSLQELASMTKQNTANAKEARSLSDGARAGAQRGGDNMRLLSAAIDKIKASSDATAKIVKTIDEIAFQTNLLALNAAVEAARAGDAGKGFAVVAEEVRNLAMRSAGAAKNTADLIEESVKNAESGVSVNIEVAKNLEDINEQSKKVSEMMAEIAAASDQQTQGVEQINTAVEQINTVTQQAAANSEESASAAEELTGQAEELLNMVSNFKLTSTAKSGSHGATRGTVRPQIAPAKAKRPELAFAGAKSGGNGNGSGKSKKAEAKKLIPFDDDEVLRDF